MKPDLSSDLEPQQPPDSPENTPVTGLGLLDEDVDSRQRAGVRWIIGPGLVLLLGLGGWFAYQRSFRAPVEPVRVATTPAKRQDVEVIVTGSGVVELGGQQTFKAPTDVTVEAVAVKERQRVAEGEILLVLRDRTLQQQLNQARVEVQKARNEYNRGRERVQERQSRRARAQERLRESQALLDQGFIAEDEFRVDQNTLEDAESNLRDAEVTLANTELELRNHELQLQTLQAQLADTQIAAPFDAVILNVHVNPGDGVQREGNLLTIGDPTQETVRLQLLTLDAQRVRPNMPVRVSVIGPNARPFTGRVVMVSPQADTSSNENSSRNDPTTVEARVVLDAPSQTLIPGSSVSVEIILERSRNAIALPITAVQMDEASPYVWVRDEDGTAQRRSVVLGLQSVEQVEIRSGLAPGDEVIPVLPPDVTLTPGTPLASPEDVPQP